MKVPSVILVCVLLAATANGKCSVVEVVTPERSSQNVKIVALHNGAPLKGVQLELYGNAAEPLQVHTTNKRGIARLRLSMPGHYRVVATSDQGVLRYLYLDAVKGKKESVFPLDLDLGHPIAPTLQNLIAIAEGATTTKTRRFAGTVLDPAGAVIPRATIKVFEKGSGGRKILATLESDSEGRFSANLRSGSYTAVFMSQGFKTNIVVIQVSPDVAEQELRVPLQLGMCT
jgi:carboxypeptidase family protein